MQVKNVWHVGAWANNYGDRALQVATQDLLQKSSTCLLNFTPINTQKTWFSPNLIRKLNSESDMLLIGGGGLIFHRPMDKSNSGWQFNIKLEDIEKIKVPIFVYGIGYNKFPYDKHEFPQHMWNTLQAIIDKSNFFSVRNHGTYNKLKEAGLDVSRVKIVPDSAMFIEPFSFNHVELQTNKIKIGLNWATDRWVHRFETAQKAKDALLSTLRAIKIKAHDLNAKVFLIEHLMPNELNEVYKPFTRRCFKEAMSGVDACILYENMHQELYPPFDYTAPLFADIYRQMDLVVGMRGHANIIPFGQNTPIIGLGEHDKIKWFLDDVMQNNKLIDLKNDKDSNTTALKICMDEVIENLDDIKNNIANEYINQYSIQSKFLHAAMRKIGWI